MIGIVSHGDDLHTVSVRQHLDAAGAEHTLLDTSQVPAASSLTIRHTSDDPWTGRWGPVAEPEAFGSDLTQLHAMWWRRPQPFQLDPAVRRSQDRGFAVGECAALVAGLWSCLDAAWVNDPDRDEAASRKTWQLHLARTLGLRVPRTCMTNDPAEARAFIDAVGGRTIYKSFSATPSTWRETRPVGEVELGLLDSVRLAPVIFQEHVAGQDTRVTIVGDRVFAATIATGAGYAYDFRVEENPTIDEHELPARVERRLLDLLQSLGLSYGAVDLRRTPEGDYVFLEINPAGQWLFVEHATGQPIAAALADLLVREDRARSEQDRRPVPVRAGALRAG